MKWIAFALFLLSLTVGWSQESFCSLSQDLLLAAKSDRSTKELETRLAKRSLKDLVAELDTDEEKKAFWINVYNAYILILLKDDPTLYNDRSAFFKKDRMTIASQRFSFDLIEHGILRKSQVSWGLGIFGKWFPDDVEKKLRVDQLDYRVHFALNCGAKDCPPVNIYDPTTLDKKLEGQTAMFVTKTTDYDASKNQALVTSLFSWFRGDFGYSKGVRDILVRYGAIPKTADPTLTYKSYDWTLDLNNFVD